MEQVDYRKHSKVQGKRWANGAKGWRVALRRISPTPEWLMTKLVELLGNRWLMVMTLVADGVYHILRYILLLV